MIERYDNNYKREHSDYLNGIFDISPNGVDYYNDYNLGFEFKESFMINQKNICYRVPEHQVEESDFFVFCLYADRFFLVDKRDIKNRFSFNTKDKQAKIRINTIKTLSFFETGNIFIMKDYIDNLEVKD